MGKYHFIIDVINKNITNHVPCQGVFQAPNNQECQQLNASGAVLVLMTAVILHHHLQGK